MNITDSNTGNTSNTSNTSNGNKEYTDTNRYTSVRITQECKAKLQQIGRLGETYSDVIERLASQHLTFERIPSGEEVAIR